MSAEETSFETTGILRLRVDEQSLREAEAEVEDRLGAAARVRTDGGSAGGAGELASLASERNDLLVDIRDLLDEGAGGGGGGGGGGAGLGIPGSGGGGGFSLLETLGLSAAASTAASAAGSASNFGALGAAGTAAGVTGGLFAGGLGIEAFEASGAAGFVRGLGQQARQDLPFGREIGDAAQFLPGAGLFAATRGLDDITGGAAGIVDPTRAGENQLVKGLDDSLTNFLTIQERRGRILGNVGEAGAEGTKSAFRAAAGPLQDATFGAVNAIRGAAGRDPVTPGGGPAGAAEAIAASDVPTGVFGLTGATGAAPGGSEEARARRRAAAGGSGGGGGLGDVIVSPTINVEGDTTVAELERQVNRGMERARQEAVADARQQVRRETSRSSVSGLRRQR